MQSKNATVIVRTMAGMRSVYKVIRMCVIWNTDVGCTLKYSKRYFRCIHGDRAIAPLMFKANIMN